MPEEKKLPDKLPINPFPIGTCELEMRRIATEYNSLPIGDPKRETVYQKYKEEYSKALWD